MPADVLAHNIVRASAETLLIQNLPWLFLISISVVIQRQNGHLLEKKNFILFDTNVTKDGSKISTKQSVSMGSVTDLVVHK